MSAIILDAGTVGDFVGATVALAEEDLQIVGKLVEHVGAMDAHSEWIAGLNSSPVSVRLSAPAALRDAIDLVFLDVKSQDTDAVFDMLSPLLGPTTTVVSQQMR